MIGVEFVVNSILSSRSYILSNRTRTEYWLVDCGDVQPLIDLMFAISGNSFLLKGILLTHAHYDHIYGLPKITTLFPDVYVYTNKEGKESLRDPRLNMSVYLDDSLVFDYEKINVCEDGFNLNLFDGVKAKVYYMPGHHPSCLVYEVDNYLFTGDAFIPGVNVVTVFPGADKAMAIDSSKRIKILAEGKIVCAGHEGKK